METETPQPPREEDVDNEMMKNILGQMYKDKDYLEKLLNENGKQCTLKQQKSDDLRIQTCLNQTLYFCWPSWFVSYPPAVGI